MTKKRDDMSFHELDSLPFDGPSRVHNSNSGLVDSAKSSFDVNYLRQHQCEVYIRDEASIAASIDKGDNSEAGVALNRYTILGNPNLSLPKGLKAELENRVSSETRWINVVGWSEALMDDLARRYLNDHGCLDLQSLSKQMLGGPIRRKDSGEFIWIQTTIWFLGGRNPNWSSVQQSGFRMVLCMPTRSNAGTLITNFVGRAGLAEEISRICTENVLANHAMGSQALGCVWILAFSILRSIAEQVDFAFQTLDPTSVSQSAIPRMDDLPFLLEKANHLARLDRYISGLDEFSSFFVSVRSFQHNRDPNLCSTTSDSESTQPYRSPNIRERASLESSLAQQKIVRAQRLCSTFLRQYESLVQMIISYSTTQITERLDNGRSIAEKFATIGIVLAGLSALISPVALLTSYYGMNVQEYVPGTSGSLFDFWQVALPTLLVCFVALGFVILRLCSTPIVKGTT